MSKKLTTNEFIQNARKIHGEYYDYSKVEYVNYNTAVCIICPIHGEFWQKPIHHLNRKGCPLCGKEKIQKSNAKRNETARNNFIENAKMVHNDKYDYSKAIYTNSHTKICIICPKHGEFWQTPTNHLSGNGCPRCIISVNDTNSFISKAEIIHNHKYDYSKSNYISTNVSVCIICPKHGEFYQTPSNHLRGNGCPKCRSSIMENKVIKKLNDKKVKFIYEYMPSFLINGKSHQSVDFYLPDYNIGIECQGVQHYEPVDFAGKGKEWANAAYVNIVKRDTAKRKLCNENGIKIFYIAYYEDVNNKLEEILRLCKF